METGQVQLQLRSRNTMRPVTPNTQRVAITLATVLTAAGLVILLLNALSNDSSDIRLPFRSIGLQATHLGLSLLLLGAVCAVIALLPRRLPPKSQANAEITPRRPSHSRSAATPEEIEQRYRDKLRIRRHPYQEIEAATQPESANTSGLGLSSSHQLKS